MAKKTKAEPDAFAKNLLAIHTREAEALERIAELLERHLPRRRRKGEEVNMEPKTGENGGP